MIGKRRTGFKLLLVLTLALMSAGMLAACSDTAAFNNLIENGKQLKAQSQANEIEGIVTEVLADGWMVNGQKILSDVTTVVTGTITVGVEARFIVRLNDAGQAVAVSVTVGNLETETPELTKTPKPTLTPKPTEVEDEREIEVEGTVTTLSANSITIAGQTFTYDPSVVVNNGHVLAVGVKANLKAKVINGVTTVVRIVAQKAEDNHKKAPTLTSTSTTGTPNPTLTPKPTEIGDDHGKDGDNHDQGDDHGGKGGDDHTPTVTSTTGTPNSTSTPKPTMTPKPTSTPDDKGKGGGGDNGGKGGKK